MADLSHGLSGNAGEYYVCAELSRRGFQATLTLRNAEGVDILATRLNSGRAITIQVKTTQGKKPQWVLSEKSEHHHSADFFYVFVRLEEVGTRPIFHIVPSDAVAKEIKRIHKEWLEGSKKDGSSRKDTSMRRFEDFEGKYLEQWGILG